MSSLSRGCEEALHALEVGKSESSLQYHKQRYGIVSHGQWKRVAAPALHHPLVITTLSQMACNMASDWWDFLFSFFPLCGAIISAEPLTTLRMPVQVLPWNNKAQHCRIRSIQKQLVKPLGSILSLKHSTVSEFKNLPLAITLNYDNRTHLISVQTVTRGICSDS